MFMSTIGSSNPPGALDVSSYATDFKIPEAKSDSKANSTSQSKTSPTDTMVSGGQSFNSIANVATQSTAGAFAPKQSRSTAPKQASWPRLQTNPSDVSEKVGDLMAAAPEPTTQELLNNFMHAFA